MAGEKLYGRIIHLIKHPKKGQYIKHDIKLYIDLEWVLTMNCGIVQVFVGIQSTWSKNVILRMTPALRMSYGSARRLVPTQHMVSN